ncbi:hypothetical protein NQ315_007483 [Exocentrus adspersus]|uniref:RNase H type-1 domain-containing protein n=1 Tax=Exocentrus adspersus TaxID=1586481 RepID=A0AAV8V7K0_9CUCU|nr:hypothetical protein NQ315_007483 [Exocentrus adspersus]
MPNEHEHVFTFFTSTLFLGFKPVTYRSLGSSSASVHRSESSELDPRDLSQKQVRGEIRNKRINILTDNQAALKGLRNHKVTSRLLWECWEELSDLARHNRVVLLWVPGHSGIKGNEKADGLARKGSSASYIGPEPAVGVSKTMVRSQVKEWVNAQHKEYLLE